MAGNRATDSATRSRQSSVNEVRRYIALYRSYYRVEDGPNAQMQQAYQAGQALSFLRQLEDESGLTRRIMQPCICISHIPVTLSPELKVSRLQAFSKESGTLMATMSQPPTPRDAAQLPEPFNVDVRLAGSPCLLWGKARSRNV